MLGSKVIGNNSNNNNIIINRITDNSHGVDLSKETIVLELYIRYYTRLLYR